MCVCVCVFTCTAYNASGFPRYIAPCQRDPGVRTTSAKPLRGKYSKKVTCVCMYFTHVCTSVCICLYTHTYLSHGCGVSGCLVHVAADVLNIACICTAMYIIHMVLCIVCMYELRTCIYMYIPQSWLRRSSLPCPCRCRCSPRWSPLRMSQAIMSVSESGHVCRCACDVCDVCMYVMCVCVCVFTCTAYNASGFPRYIAPCQRDPGVRTTSAKPLRGKYRKKVILFFSRLIRTMNEHLPRFLLPRITSQLNVMHAMGVFTRKRQATSRVCPRFERIAFSGREGTFCVFLRIF